MNQPFKAAIIAGRSDKPADEIRDCAVRLEAFADGMDVATKQPTPMSCTMRKSAEWLEKASRNICGQGYFGCYGGPGCTSDHK